MQAQAPGRRSGECLHSRAVTAALRSATPDRLHARAWHGIAWHLSPNAHERTNLPSRRLRHCKEPWHGGCFTWAHGVSVARLLTATATMSARSAYAFDLAHTREAYRQRHEAIRLPQYGPSIARIMLIVTPKRPLYRTRPLASAPPDRKAMLVGRFSHSIHCYDRPHFAPFISPRARAVSRTGLAVWAACKASTRRLANR